MRIKIYALLWVMSLLLTLACTNSNEEVVRAKTDPTGIGKTPVCFSVSRQHIFDLTRSATSIDAFDANEPIKVYVMPDGEASYAAYDYATQESGSTKVKLSPITTPAYFPAGESTTVEAYAYYPATATATFSVQDDQTSKENYKLSDLMFASSTVIIKDDDTDGNGVLTMNHQMAQLKITANAKEGSGLNIIGVTVEAQKSVTFSPEEENVTTTTGEKGTITALNAAGTGYIVIPPQAVEGVTVRIITGEGTDEEIATYVIHGEGSFMAGRSYEINLTVTANELGLTSFINDWNGLGTVTVTPSGNLTIMQINPVTYTGSALQPSITVKKDGVTASPSDYDVQYVNNINAGRAYVIVSGKDNTALAGCVGVTSFTIAPAAGVISYASNTETQTYTNPNFTKTLSNNGDGAVTYASSNTDVATVNQATGEVTILKSGTSVITATVTDGANYVYANKTASYTLTVNKAPATITFANSAPSKTWSPTTANNTFTQAVTNQGPGNNTATGTVTYTLEDNNCGATISGTIITFSESGSVRVTATVTDNDYYTYATKSVSYVLTVNKATGNISLASNSGDVNAGLSTTITVNSSHGGTLSAAPTSGATTRVSITGPTNKVFTVSTNGSTSATVTITVTCAADEHYNAATATYTLTINSVIDKWKNPLYYISEYNVNNSAGTAFATTQNAGYFFTWYTAMSKFAKQETSYDTYQTASKGPQSKWHLPVQAELWSIIPADFDDILSFDSGSGTYKSAYITPKWGYNSTTKNGVSESSYWKRKSANSDGYEIHAIRFLGTEYCSAWKYIYANSMLTIYATLIEMVENSSTAAANWYSNKFSTVYWGNSDTEGAVKREIYATGYRDSSYGNGEFGAAGQSQQGVWGKFWSATQSSDTNQAIRVLFGASGARVDNLGKGNGQNVRLFLDH